MIYLPADLIGVIGFNVSFSDSNLLISWNY